MSAQTNEHYARKLAREGVQGIVDRMGLRVDDLTRAHMERAYLQGRLAGLKWAQDCMRNE